MKYKSPMVLDEKMLLTAIAKAAGLRSLSKKILAGVMGCSRVEVKEHTQPWCGNERV
jgi:hypothetical protein